jgi:tRNA 2-thiouridine synthesizing protein E
MSVQVNQNVLEGIEFDGDGYMVDPNTWTPEVAEAIAESIDITLTDRHWVVINFARETYEQTGEPPTLRKITKTTDVNTKELYALFPKGPAGKAAKVSGLGKPTGCI